MYNISDEAIDKISSLLKSKNYFRYKGFGEVGECDLFEKHFSNLLSKDKMVHSILLNSGTSSLITALAVLGVGKGDEVIIPVNTFVATALAVIKVGAVPILVNSDSSLTISPKDIEEKISSKTKAIIPVHLDGLICNLDEILLIAKKHNIYIVEDVAQAIGGCFRGKRLGTFGSFGCYSLNVDKIISSGEGGVLLTSDKDLYHKAFYYHDPASQYGPTKKEMLNEVAQNKEFNLLFSSSRVSEIQGIMALEQLKTLDQTIKSLRKTKNKIIHELNESFPRLKIPRGMDHDGECATTLHLLLNSSEHVIFLTKHLLGFGHEVMPLSMRLAHFGWQWKNILPYKFQTSNYLETLDISVSTLRLCLRPDWSEDKIKILIDELKKKLAFLQY